MIESFAKGFLYKCTYGNLRLISNFNTNYFFQSKIIYAAGIVFLAVVVDSGSELVTPSVVGAGSGLVTPSVVGAGSGLVTPSVVGAGSGLVTPSVVGACVAVSSLSQKQLNHEHIHSLKKLTMSSHRDVYKDGTAKL